MRIAMANMAEAAKWSLRANMWVEERSTAHRRVKWHRASIVGALDDGELP